MAADAVGTRLPLSPYLALRLAGMMLIVAGLAFLIHAFVRFALEGAGTPAPVAPTERLVVGGIYRHVRNPMYVAVLVDHRSGRRCCFSRSSLVLYAGIVAVAMFAFVRLYEEPLLAHRYGAAYAAYRNAVPGWLPRLTPWRANTACSRVPVSRPSCAIWRSRNRGRH